MFRVFRFAAAILLLFGTGAATAADACKTPVSAEEILNGIQAGFEDGAPFNQAFFVGGVRGFIDFESNGGGVLSEQCQSDHIWVGVYFGGRGASEQAAIDDLTSFRKIIPQVSFFVDGVPLGIGLRTENRVRSNPFAPPTDPFLAYALAGTIIEPFSLAPGLHTARIEILLEFVPGAPFVLPFEVDFNVIAAKQNKTK